jgi:hypothetical protein
MPIRDPDNSTKASSGNSYGADPTTLRLQLLRNGYGPVPVVGPGVKSEAAGKGVFLPRWQIVCAAPGEKEVSRWIRDYRTSTNTGIHSGRTPGADIDVRVAELVRQLVGVARTRLGDTPLERVGMAPKTLLAYRADVTFKKISTVEFALPGDDWTSPGYKWHKVEILAEGQQFVAYGIHPDTLEPYQWIHGGPDTIPWADLPVITEAQARAFVDEAEAILRAAGGIPKAEVEGKAEKKAAFKPSKGGAKVIDFEKAASDNAFFREVNRQALGAIEAWFPQIFPTSEFQSRTGAWRVSSEDLGRQYEEDLSMHPVKGGYDFGPEKSVSPIDVVMEHGGTSDPVQAALWLCDQIGVDPKTLGWKEKATKEQKKRQSRIESGDKVSDHPKADRILNIGSDVEIARDVVQDLVGRFGEVVSCDGAFWRYTGTHWEAIADEILWLAVHAYDGARFVTAKGTSPVKLGRTRIESILACMKPEIARPDFFAEAAVGINCASGFIRFDGQGTPTLEPHSRDHRQRHVLAGRWPVQVSLDQKRKSLLKKLLSGCFRDDPDKNKKIALLAEVAGVAALGYATRMIKPKALVLKGETAENGKSQVLDCMRSLLPKEAVSSISPARFDDRTFACHLVGKLLNAPDELAGTEPWRRRSSSRSSPATR